MALLTVTVCCPLQVSLPALDAGLAAYYVIAMSEASSNLSRYDGVRYGLRAQADDLKGMYASTRQKGLGDEVKRRILTGSYALSAGFYDAYYKKAQQVITPTFLGGMTDSVDLGSRRYLESIHACRQNLLTYCTLVTL